MAFTTTIEPPPRWAPAQAWRNFLAGLERLPQDDEAVRFAREQAERRLAEMETRSLAAGAEGLISVS